MAPYIFGVSTYLVCQVVAILFAIVITLRVSSAASAPVLRVLAALTVLVSAAVVGAVLTAPDFHPTAGLRYPGAGIAVLVVLPLVRRVLAGRMSLLALGDLTAPSLAFGMAVGKVGCFLHGCCHGHPSTLPWAVSVAARSPAWFDQVQAGLINATATQSLPVHPLQLYCTVWLIGVGSLMLAVRRRMIRDGQLLLLTLCLYAIGLFVNDRWKVPPDPFVQSCAVAMVLLTGAWFIAVTARSRAVRMITQRA